MICNIIDRRALPYRWKRINAIVEPTWHDNLHRDSDPSKEASDDIAYEEREAISLADAVAWANSRPYPVTLFL